MDYTELTAAELKALCLQKGIKPSRAKADMIEDLKARDAADELTRLSQELGLPDEPLTASEEAWPPQVPDELRGPLSEPTARPVQPLTTFPWVEDGLYLKTFDRRDTLDQGEHEMYLRMTAEGARADGFETYGPPYRVHSRTMATEWVYGINVR